MNLVLSAMQLPVRLRPAAPMSDLELMRFSTANETLRVEREPNGDILVMTPAGSRTAKMNMAIGHFLYQWAEADGRGLTFDSNGGFTLSDGSVRAADAAWVSLRRWDALSEEQQTGFSPLCPDFVIELRSPRDGLAELERKMDQWIENGSQVAWMLDPQRRMVAIYRPGQVVDTLVDPTSVQGDGPVAGFELVLSRIWG